jgi:hypothetical protein
MVAFLPEGITTPPAEQIDIYQIIRNHSGHWGLEEEVHSGVAGCEWRFDLAREVERRELRSEGIPEGVSNTCKCPVVEEGNGTMSGCLGRAEDPWCPMRLGKW